MRADKIPQRTIPGFFISKAEVISHEVGHIIEQILFHNAPNDMQIAIVDAYIEHVKNKLKLPEAMDADEVIKSTRPVGLAASVTGKARNISSSTINFASISVNFYDKDGKVLNTSSAEAQNLEAGEIWNFSVQCSGPDMWKIAKYDMTIYIK